MRLHPRVRLICGLLAVVATLLLSSPGVQIAAAEDAIAKPAEASDAAKPDSAAKAKANFVPPASVGEDEVVVLNGRGFNYVETGIPARPAPPPSK